MGALGILTAPVRCQGLSFERVSRDDARIVSRPVPCGTGYTPSLGDWGEEVADLFRIGVASTYRYAARREAA